MDLGNEAGYNITGNKRERGTRRHDTPSRCRQ